MQSGVVLPPKIDRDSNIKLAIGRSTEIGSLTNRSSSNTLKDDLGTLINRASVLKKKHEVLNKTQKT